MAKQGAKVPLVFVCYSRRDGETLEELRTHLRPFEQRGELRVWYDLKIAAGDTPDARIQQVIAEADIVLMLVSPNFLASAYIEEKELPPIVEAGAAREKWVVPFFVRPSLASDKGLTFATGDGRQVQLTYWQGLNQPNHVLPEGGHARDQGFVDGCKHLLALAREVKAATRAASPKRKVRPVSAAPPGQDRPEIALRLTVAGTTLHREFLGAHGWRRMTQTDGFVGLGAATKVWEPEVMFTALFGSEAECVDLLRETRGLTVRTSPVSNGGLRLRIHADDPRLLAQPWLRTTWKQNSLIGAGWSFELSSLAPDQAVRAAPLLRLELPCTLVAVKFDPGQRLHCDVHLQQVCTIGSRAGPGQAPDATSVHDLNGLVHHRPDVLYVCGVASVEAGELWLSSDAEGGRTRLADVVATWERHPPKVVFLNLLDAPVGTSQAAIGRLASRFPLVVLQCARLAQVGATPGPFQTAERFLEGLLHGDDPDPVQLVAAHGLPAVHVWSHFGQFVRPKTRLVQRLSPQRDLDREDQRAQALLQCKTLCEDPSHRTALLLAHGEPGNHLDQLGQQLQHTLHGSLSPRRLVWRVPRTPDGRLLADALAEHFDATLQVPHGVCRREALAERHREWFKPKTIGLILIDTGVFGGRHGAPLRASDLETMVQFCGDELAPSCPDTCRIVILTSLEVERAKFATIARMAATLRDDRQTHLFRFRSLDPLEAVTRHDLKSYLDKPGSGCPPPSTAAFAAAVHEASQGRFEDAVRLLDQAAIDGWSPQGLAQVQAGRPPAPPPPRLTDETL
jgi:hypothetical protein